MATQNQMQRFTSMFQARLWHALVEIQSGPNPLTDKELDQLAARRPMYKLVVTAWKNR